jgi:diadenosine tetraphosphatase ApaH/serine/threonine PP2A family protein phosphatase
MKLALLSDIHANIQGLEACLEHARVRGANQIAILGDLVGYGADPSKVVNRVMGLADNGAWLIKGNHDVMAVNPPAVARTLGDSTAAWTHAQLTTQQRAFLAQLPMTAQHGSVYLVHASVDEPAQWRYVYELEAALDSLEALTQINAARHVFVGHVHQQTLYRRSRTADFEEVKLPAFNDMMGRGRHDLQGRVQTLEAHSHWLATVGSAGQPRDGNPQAMYALFDTVTLAFEFHRVDYDHLEAAAAIRRAGLPAWLAQRLELGR